MRSREVFRPDVGLRARMVLALALNVALLAALVVLAAWLLTVYWGPVVLVVLAVLAAAGGAAGSRRWRRYMLSAERAEPLGRAVERLCLVADLDRPMVALIDDAAPRSWTTALPGRRPRVHVTTGMVELLDDAEQLDAVLAHELSHIGNRDAAVMTVLAAPGTYVLRGLRVTGGAVATHASGAALLITVPLMLLLTVLALPAFLSAFFARIVSRHRELAADRGAALITGSPAALAAALTRLSDDAIPRRDLRLGDDVLNIVPARTPDGLARLWATHPPLAVRIAQLERLEARLQA